MPFRGTYIFNSGRYGWTETWFYAADGATADTAAAAFLAAGTERIGLLGAFANLEVIRTSDETVLGDGDFDDSLADQETPVQKEFSADTPMNAWLCRFQAGTLSRRQVWLRGIPDDWIQRDATLGVFVKDSELVANFNQFLSTVIGKLSLRTYSRNVNAATNLPDNPKIPITDINVSLPGQISLTTATPHGFLAGAKVRVGRNKGYNMYGFTPTGPKKINGTWRILRVSTPTTFDLPLTGVPGMPPVLTSPGYLTGTVYSYPKVTSGKLERPEKRDTGRAFFVQAGRRKVFRTGG